MKKRRITLNLDEDVVEALRGMGERAGRSLSSIASDALRDAVEGAAHRAALGEWLDELDERYGAPSAEHLAEADAFLNAVEAGQVEDAATMWRRTQAERDRAAG